MKKREFKKLPIKPVTAHMIEQAKRIANVSYWLDAESKIIAHKRTLVISVYAQEDILNNQKQPIYRVFQQKHDYVTQDFTNGSTWKTGGIYYLMSDFYPRKSICCVNARAEKAMQQFFRYLKKPEKKGYDLLCLAQEQIRAERLKKRHQAIIQAIDTKMKEIKALPKDFDDWIDKTAMAHSRYIYYKYSRKKQMDGYCTYCKTDVKISGAKHRGISICPNCGKKVTFLAEGKARHIADRGIAAFPQKTPAGFVIRYFSIYKTYRENYRTPSFYVHECKRDFYEQDKVYFYEWRDFKLTRKTRWCEGWQKYFFGDSAVYTKNLDKALAGTAFQYCALKQFATRYEGAGVYVYGYLYTYLKNPYLEYFVKAKLYHMTDCMSKYHMDFYSRHLDDTAKSLPAMLKIPKQYLVVVQELDMSFSQVSLFQKLIQHKIAHDAKSFLQFEEKYGAYTQYIFSILQYTTLHKIERYTAQQTKFDMKTMLMLWRDYLEFTEELGYNMKNSFVLFPKHLKDAHDTAYQDVEKQREEKRLQQLLEDNQKFQQLYTQYQQQYAWADKDFLVVVPKDLFAIKEEGYYLHHCVGTYIHRVAASETFILFLRSQQKPEKPLYTLEVKQGRIIQCKGFDNVLPGDDVRKFLRKYIRILNKRQQQQHMQAVS